MDGQVRWVRKVGLVGRSGRLGLEGSQFKTVTRVGIGQHIAVLYFSVIWVVKYSTRWEPHIWGWQIVNGAVEAKNGQFASRFLQNVHVDMDSGKYFFFRSHFSLFQPQNLAVFGGHGQFSGNPVPQVGFAGNPVLLRNALIEPQILQSKCSEQLCRILGSSQLEPKIRKIDQMVSGVQLNCVFEGLKMAQK